MPKYFAFTKKEANYLANGLSSYMNPMNTLLNQVSTLCFTNQNLCLFGNTSYRKLIFRYFCMIFAMLL